MSPDPSITTNPTTANHVFSRNSRSRTNPATNPRIPHRIRAKAWVDTVALLTFSTSLGSSSASLRSISSRIRCSRSSRGIEGRFCRWLDYRNLPGSPLSPFVPLPGAQKRGREGGPSPEAVLDPVQGSLRVLPPTFADQRDLLTGRGDQAAGRHPDQAEPPSTRREGPVELAGHRVQVGRHVRRRGERA